MFYHPIILIYDDSYYITDLRRYRVGFNIKPHRFEIGNVIPISKFNEFCINIHHPPNSKSYIRPLSEIDITIELTYYIFSCKVHYFELSTLNYSEITTNDYKLLDDLNADKDILITNYSVVYENMTTFNKPIGKCYGYECKYNHDISKLCDAYKYFSICCLNLHYKSLINGSILKLIETHPNIGFKLLESDTLKMDEKY